QLSEFIDAQLAAGSDYEHDSERAVHLGLQEEIARHQQQLLSQQGDGGVFGSVHEGGGERATPSSVVDPGHDKGERYYPRRERYCYEEGADGAFPVGQEEERDVPRGPQDAEDQAPP